MSVLHHQVFTNDIREFRFNEIGPESLSGLMKRPKGCRAILLRS